MDFLVRQFEHMNDGGYQWRDEERVFEFVRNERVKVDPSLGVEAEAQETDFLRLCRIIIE